MLGKKRKNTSKRKREKKTTLLPILIPLFLLILSAGIYLLIDRSGLNEDPSTIIPKLKETISKSFNEKDTPQQIPVEVETSDLDLNNQSHSQQSLSQKEFTVEDLNPNQNSPSGFIDEIKEDLDVMLDSDSEKKKLAEICEQSSSIIMDFYKHLDKQPYIKTFNIKTTSSAHFTELIQDLLDHPPVVSRETDDLFTILQNTAHFFRIIGKDNILLLKGILDREKEYFENVLSNFYTVTTLPDCPQNSFDISIPQDALYDYAGFFLNTMGGRLYLFRRDSVSRMTVNYYAILIVDQANREDNNRHGIELQPAINSLIAEIEGTNNQLRMKESYLDKLYDLKEKYQLEY